MRRLVRTGSLPVSSKLLVSVDRDGSSTPSGEAMWKHALCALLVLVAMAAISQGGAAAATEAPSDSERLTVTVLRFENQTGDPDLDHWGHTINVLLSERLGEVAKIRGGVSFARRNLNLDENTPVDASIARKIGEVIETRRVVWGSYAWADKKWHLSAHVLNVATGDTSSELTATSADWFDLLDGITDEILAWLGMKPSAQEQERIARRWTRSLDALELASRALFLEKSAPASELEALARRAVALDPQFSEARCMLAGTLASQGETEEAEEAAREALKVKPDSVWARLVLANLLGLENRLAEADKILAEAHDLDPDDSDVLSSLGRLYAAEGNEDKAIAAFEKASLLNPFDAAIRGALGLVYASKGDRSRAMEELKEAERFSVEDVNAQQMMALGYRKLGETPLAIEHHEAFVTLAREQGLDPEFIRQFEEALRLLQASLTPVSVEAQIPKGYTPAALQAELRKRLTDDELKLVVNPLSSTPQMKEWAEAITETIATDLEKAKALFEKLSRRMPREGHHGIRTARDVFAAWETAAERMVCQDYAKLYVALAREIGIPAWYVHVDRNYAGEVVPHDCAAVFIDGECLLVDAAYRWFGVPHREFVVFDDIGAIAHHLCQRVEGPAWLVRYRIARKLQPDSAWVRLRLAHALIESERWEEAKAEVAEAARLEPGRVEESLCRGAIAFHTGDYESAVEHFRRAVEASPRDAQGHFNLGHALLRLKRLGEARKALREGLRRDPPPDDAAAARIELARLNELLGTEPGDDSNAVDELRQAAADGDVRAQFGLGMMYYEGVGVPRDDAAALGWFLKAAELGDPKAQCALGAAYAEGRGVPRNYAEAVKWWREAAEQGVAEAQYNLGLTYANGHGVTQDLAEAYVWMSLARGSILEADNAAYKIAADLTPGQLTEARERVAVLRKTISRR